MEGQTIIIKKIKKGGHGHHGGAWKVAYADFVTAMMAFFLLLWLLSATPVENLKGLADYFSPTLGLQDRMGIGFRGGLGPHAEGVTSDSWAGQGLIFGSPPSGPILQFPERDNKAESQYKRISFSQLEETINKTLEKDTDLAQSGENIDIEQTPEGLQIRIHDTENRSMFKTGTSELLPHAQKILARIAGLIRDIPHYIKIEGHTYSIQPPNMSEEFTNWELSINRANAARRHLLASGLDKDQIALVVGKADKDLIERAIPESITNNRISITILKKGFLAIHKQPAPDDILMNNTSDGLTDYIKRKKEKSKDRKELLDQNF